MPPLTAETAAAGWEQTALGAWHRLRDYQEAGQILPATVVVARERGERSGAHRERDRLP